MQTERHPDIETKVRAPGSGKLTTNGAITRPYGESPIRFQNVSTVGFVYSPVEPTVETRLQDIHGWADATAGAVCWNLGYHPRGSLASIEYRDHLLGYDDRALSGCIIVPIAVNKTEILPAISNEQIRSLLELQENWDEDGAPAPNFTAALNADKIMSVVNDMGFRESRIMPSVEGGIAIAFQVGNKYADLETMNSGAILAVRSDRRSDPIVWEIQSDDIAATLLELREFLAS